MKYVLRQTLRGTQTRMRAFIHGVSLGLAVLVGFVLFTYVVILAERSHRAKRYVREDAAIVECRDTLRGRPVVKANSEGHWYLVQCVLPNHEEHFNEGR